MFDSARQALRAAVDLQERVRRGDGRRSEPAARGRDRPRRRRGGAGRRRLPRRRAEPRRPPLLPRRPGQRCSRAGRWRTSRARSRASSTSSVGRCGSRGSTQPVEVDRRPPRARGRGAATSRSAGRSVPSPSRRHGWRRATRTRVCAHSTRRDAADFFGREALTEHLVARLARDALPRRRRPERQRQVVGRAGRPRAGAAARRASRLRALVRSSRCSRAPIRSRSSRRRCCASADSAPAGLLEQLEEDERGLLRAVKRLLAGRRVGARARRRPARGGVHARRGRGAPHAVPRASSSARSADPHAAACAS